jgi:hypothetical protein
MNNVAVEADVKIHKYVPPFPWRGLHTYT